MQKNKKKPKDKVILVFAAHSDDQIFGPGATLAKYTKEGKKIYSIILSNGISSLPWLKENIAIKTRISESKKADKIIGGKGLLFFNLSEGRFIESFNEQGIEKKIISFIKKIKPEKIFTHSFEDPHPDHRATFKILEKIIKKARINTEVYLFDVWNPITIRKQNLPKMYVDVTDTFNLKIKALRCFPSQWSSMIALLWSVYVKAIIHGFHIHKRYAERFFKVR